MQRDSLTCLVTGRVGTWELNLNNLSQKPVIKKDKVYKAIAYCLAHFSFSIDNYKLRVC